MLHLKRGKFIFVQSPLKPSTYLSLSGIFKSAVVLIQAHQTNTGV